MLQQPLEGKPCGAREPGHGAEAYVALEPASVAALRPGSTDDGKGSGLESRRQTRDLTPQGLVRCLLAGVSAGTCGCGREPTARQWSTVAELSATAGHPSSHTVLAAVALAFLPRRRPGGARAPPRGVIAEEADGAQPHAQRVRSDAGPPRLASHLPASCWVPGDRARGRDDRSGGIAGARWTSSSRPVPLVLQERSRSLDPRSSCSRAAARDRSVFFDEEEARSTTSADRAAYWSVQVLGSTAASPSEGRLERRRDRRGCRRTIRARAGTTRGACSRSPR